MAQTKVSDLTALTSPDGSEELLVNDGGTSKKVTIDNLLYDESIDSDHYVDGSIDTAHIADDQITLAKMASGTDGNLITYDASGNPIYYYQWDDVLLQTTDAAVGFDNALLFDNLVPLIDAQDHCKYLPKPVCHEILSAPSDSRDHHQNVTTVCLDRAVHEDNLANRCAASNARPQLHW